MVVVSIDGAICLSAILNVVADDISLSTILLQWAKLMEAFLTWIWSMARLWL